jgi:hypothetical protein
MVEGAGLKKRCGRNEKRRLQKSCANLLRDFSQARSGNSRKSFLPRDNCTQRKRLKFSTVLFFAGPAIARTFQGIPKKESSVTRQHELAGAEQTALRCIPSQD